MFPRLVLATEQVQAQPILYETLSKKKQETNKGNNNNEKPRE